MFVRGKGVFGGQIWQPCGCRVELLCEARGFFFGAEEVCVGLGRFVRLGIGVWGSGSVQRMMQRSCWRSTVQSAEGARLGAGAGRTGSGDGEGVTDFGQSGTERCG